MPSDYLEHEFRRLYPKLHELPGRGAYVPPPEHVPVSRETRIDRAVTLALAVCTFTALGFLMLSAWVFGALQ